MTKKNRYMMCISFIALLFLFTPHTNAYEYDITLNITHYPFNVTDGNITTTFYETNYSLTPYSLEIEPHTTLSIELNNFDVGIQDVSFDSIGMNTTITWYTYILIPNATGYGTVTFNDIESGFLRINISELNTTLYSQPAIFVNVTEFEEPFVPTYVLDVHDCMNFTIIHDNSSVQKITICGNTTSCSWDDLSPDVQSNQLTTLTSTIQSWLGVLNNTNGAGTNTTTESVRYLWEVTPDAQDLLLELRDLKNCDVQVNKARNDVINFYTGEIKKKNEELAGVASARDTCTSDKNKFITLADKYAQEVQSCERMKRNETQSAIDNIRQNEVLPAMIISTLIILGVLILALYKMYGNSKPIENNLER